MKSRRLVSTAVFFVGIGWAAVLIFWAAPVVRAQQDADSPETVLEQDSALAAESNPEISTSAFEMFPSAVISAPLFIGVDDAAIPTYRVDPVTANAYPAFAGYGAWGAAYDSENNRIFFNVGTTLYEWEIGGAVSSLGTILGPGATPLSIVGLAYYDGNLYAVRNIANEAVYLIDTTTVSATIYIDYADDEYDFGGLAVDPYNGVLYATNDDSTPHGAGLFSINQDGTASSVAAYPGGETDIDGLAVSHDGLAYLVTDEPGDIYVYDLSLNSYLTPVANPWTTAETFSAGAWVFEPAIGVISLNKTVGTDPNACAATDTITVPAGTEVTYCYEVTNNGPISLTLHSLEDTDLGVILSNFNYNLMPGSSAFLTQTVTLYDTTVNTATWKAYNQVGYTVTDTVPFNFEDISATGTSFPLGDDQMGGPYPIGFDFNFYGANYSNVYASSNGFLTLLAGQSTGCCTGRSIPLEGNPDGLIAGWWEDLDPAEPGAGLHYQTLGMAPNRRFILQYTNVQHWPSGNPVTFQYKLFEGSSTIEVHYLSAPSDGGTHSAGVENQDGTFGTQYFRGIAPLAAPLAIRYTPQPTMPGAANDSALVDVLFPEIGVDPPSMEPYQGVNMVVTHTLTISNIGQADLYWAIEEDAADSIASSNSAPAGSAGAEPGSTPTSDVTDLSSYPADELSSYEIEAIAPIAFPTGPAGYGVVFYADRLTFDSDFPGLPVEDFEAGLWGDGAIVSCPAPFDASTDNACFSLGGILPGISFQDNPLNNLGGGTLNGLAGVGAGALGALDKNIVANTFVDSFEILFDPPVNAAGMDLVHYTTNGTQVEIAIFDISDSLIMTTTAWADNMGTFWGVSSNTLIGRINVLSPLTSGDGAEGVDNVAFGVFCSPPEDIPWVSTDPATGTLIPGDGTQVSVVFDSTGLSPGTYTGRMCVTSNDLTDPQVVVPLTMTVSAAAVNLTPAVQTVSGLPGDDLTYTFMVENPGLAADNYALATTGNSWPALLSTTSTGALGPGESQLVTLTVNIPPGVQNGDIDIATVVATSSLDPLVSDSAVATTTAVVRRIYVPVILKN